MLERAGLTASADNIYWRTLVTDSHYTCDDLAKSLFDVGVGLIGTVRLATKSRSPAQDIKAYKNTPWTRLTPKVASYLQRGQHRLAYKVTVTRGNRPMLMMAASVKDKSHFGLLMTANCTGLPKSGTFTMPRRVRGVRDPIIVDTFPALQSYSTGYGGADKLDRGIAQFSMQHTSPRYYMRIFWWTQELIVSSVYQYVQAHVPQQAAAAGTKKGKYVPGNIDFLKYASGTNTTSARAEFILDLSASLADLGRRLDQDQPAELLAEAIKAGKAGGAAAEARGKKLLVEVIEAVDACVFPTTAPGHDLIEAAALEHRRCFVCEQVTQTMLPHDVAQTERRKYVNWVRSFCVGCAGGLGGALRVMCPFCHDNNWDHVGQQLKPADELRLAKAAAAPRTAAAAATPTASAQQQRRHRRSTDMDDLASKRKAPSPQQVAARLANLRRAPTSAGRAEAGRDEWETSDSESGSD